MSKKWGIFTRNTFNGVKPDQDQDTAVDHPIIDAPKIESHDGSFLEISKDGAIDHKQAETYIDTSHTSMQFNVDSHPRRKRPKDPDEMSGIDHRKKRSPVGSMQGRSPSPSADVEVLEQADSPVDLEPSALGHGDSDEPNGLPPTELLKDLETRSITVAQLIQEVKGIYAGLVMVEKKCIEIVTQQTQNPTKLSKEQWQALIALHRTLLNEHHDFFSASHHPITKNHELRELAARYAMPARMWRHGIHAFLELLRHRLPDSLEHMLSFVYLAYSMMALLKETVPDFLETWIECLGDLARYRMAIEEADLRDREIWSNTARTWYNEAADLSPNTGRIQHHLAVLARPNIVQQLFLYSKALVAAIPFKNAGESILLLYNPLLDQTGASASRYQPTELNLVCAGAVLFKRRQVIEYETFRNGFESSLETHLTRSGSRFKVQGPEIAGSLFAMLMDFGNVENTLWSMLSNHQQKLKQLYCQESKKDIEKLPKDFVAQDLETMDLIRAEYWHNAVHGTRIPLPGLPANSNFTTSDQISAYVAPMLYKTISDVASQIGNKNVVPFMHMTLAYLLGLTWVPDASIYVEKCIPWDKVVQFLNTVGRSGVTYDNIEGDGFPKSFGGNKKQLPEDFTMRGLMALLYYYKPDFFNKDDLVDEDERLLEQPSHQAPRVERCLYAAIQITRVTNNRWISYDQKTKLFSTTTFGLNLPEE